MSGASITLTKTNTNAVRTTSTTEAGVYTIPDVPPGSYTVKTEVTGFRAWFSKPFEVQVQQSVRLDVVLQVGNTSETMEVSAGAAQLQSENATLGTVIDNRL